MRPEPDSRPPVPYLPGESAGGADHGADPGADRGTDPGADPEADPEAVTRKILLDQLTGQARTRAELAARLERKGVPAGLAQRMLDRFEEVGLVDDRAFARAWVQSRQSGRGLSRRALAQELRRKGVDDDAAQAALDDVDPDDEIAAARALVRRRLRGAAGLERNVALRRLTGMLARKGYPAGTAFRVVREELERAGHPVDDVPDALD